MSLVTEKDIYLELNANTQEEALKELATIAFEQGKVDSAETFYQQLCLREKESTTGFGKGIAIPHARHTCVKNAGIIVARNNSELEWNSIDGSKVNVLICLIAPDDKNDFHLKMLSKLARKLIYDDFINILKTADTEELIKEINHVLD